MRLVRAPARAEVALATTLCVALLAGCGDGDGGESAGRLVWVGTPKVYRSKTLPNDRVLSGTVRNDSLRRVEIDTKDVRLVDRDGDRVGGTAVFLRTFAHQLFPPTREPAGGIPEQELLRLGVKAKLDPGKEAPLTVSWRISPGRERPVRVDTGQGSLPIP